MPDLKDIVQGASDQEVGIVRSAFGDVMTQKIADAIAGKREEIGASLFGAEKPEEVEADSTEVEGSEHDVDEPEAEADQPEESEPEQEQSDEDV